MLPEWHELIVDKYVKIEDVFSAASYIREVWCEPHRYFHTLEHLDDILSKIKTPTTDNVEGREILVLAAYFHDVIYNPLSMLNEERSAELCLKVCTHPAKDRIAQIILDTKHHDETKISDELSSIFCKFDTAILTCTDYQKLLQYENQIMREYQVYDYNLYYKDNRANFLKHAAVVYNNPMLESLAAYVKARILKVGLYTGSFNNFHIGHYSILYKAEQIFDKVIICSGLNPEKVNKMATDPEAIRQMLLDRKQSLESIVPYHQSHAFSHSMPRLLEEFAAYQLTIVKGIRGSKDLEEENLQRAHIEDVVDNYSIIYVPADRRYGHVSSSGVRFLENEGKTDSKSKEWAQLYTCDIFQPHPIQKLLEA